MMRKMGRMKQQMTGMKCSAEMDRLMMKVKTAHFGRFAGKHSDVRKAYVTLKSGQEINFAEVK